MNLGNIDLTKEEFDSMFLGKRIWCSTEELANEFLRLADSVGYRWASGDELSSFNNWDIHKNGTYYMLKKNDWKEISVGFNNIYETTTVRIGATVQDLMDHFMNLVDFNRDKMLLRLEKTPKYTADLLSPSLSGMLEASMQKSKEIISKFGKCEDQTKINSSISNDFVSLIDLVYVNEKKKEVVVKWKDGDETRAKCGDKDEFDLEVGFFIAIGRKIFPTRSQSYKWLSKGRFAKHQVEMLERKEEKEEKDRYVIRGGKGNPILTHITKETYEGLNSLPSALGMELMNGAGKGKKDNISEKDREVK